MADDRVFVQQKDRILHTSNSGIEIVRTLYVEPYKAHEAVIKKLQGSVKDHKRTPPAHDPWITNCYCTEARVEHEDPRVLASSPGLEGKTGDTPQPSLINQLQEKSEPENGLAGAMITAHYRPLITAWDVSSKDPQGKFPQFDWLDPTYSPSIRQLPWPDGLFVGARTQAGGGGGLVNVCSVPKEAGNPYGVTITDFSIRRILVDEIPWKAITNAANALNEKDWPKAGSGAAKNLPTFKPHTLKFIGADAENMIDTEGNRWYELTYNFRWIHLFSDSLFRDDGQKVKGWVTWNHIFCRPWWLVWAGETGWYKVYRGEQRKIAGIVIPDVPGLGKKGGELHESCDFDVLFELK